MKRDNNQNNNLTIMLGAGGTGGHLFPAEALASELLKRGYKIIFATDRRGAVFYGKSSLQKKSNIVMYILPSATWGRGILGKITALVTVGFGILKSIWLVKKYKVKIAVGFGGYPSFPPLYAAQFLKIPTILHEQNAILGKANARLAVRANNLALTVSNTKAIDRYREKAVTVGNPVRNNILRKQQTPPIKMQGELNIFLMGGSQGAKIFGDIIPFALAKLPKDLQQKINLTMQVRQEQLNSVKNSLEAIQIKAELKSFFTDVEEKLSNCHLFIGRSGASSVADVTTIGRAAIFVPMQHQDQQQKLNADVVADAGGAWVIEEKDFTADILAKKIEEFFKFPHILEEASLKSAKSARSDAAKLLADLVESNLKLKEIKNNETVTD